MVNYHDPVTIAREFAALVKVWHFVDGVFVWEFFTTLDYEWDVYQGNRPYGWSIWAYSTTRLSTLIAVILNMIGFDIVTPINCQVWVTLEICFSYLAFSTSSMLIMLRVYPPEARLSRELDRIAIWNKDKIIYIISIGIWTANISVLIYGAVRLHSTWSPGTQPNSCAVFNFESTLPASLSILFTDIVLLLIMLIGLLRMRLKGAGALHLAHFLWRQGLMWLFVATCVELPSSVFMILNLNVPLDLMPQTPCMIVVTMAATRIYRSLLNYCTSDMVHEAPSPVGGGPLSEMGARPESIPVNRTEVSVRTERNHFPTLQNPYVNTHRERYKAHEVSFDGDVECGPEK